MKTSEVLNRAADLIEERGWSGRGFSRTGASPWGGGAGGDGPLCLEGAIAAALGIDLTIQGSRCILLWPTAAYGAVADYLDHRRDIDGAARLWFYNDTHTQAEVVEVLRAAAAIEQARESQPAEVSA